MSHLKLFAERFRPPPRRTSARLDATQDGNRCDVTLGRFSFFLRSDFDPGTPRETFDHAVIGGAILAWSHNIALESDLPVTRSCAEALERLRTTLLMWHVRKTYPLPLTLTHVVEDPPPVGNRGALCMSGGVDSTFAAFETHGGGDYDLGVLVAGADYASAEDPRFQMLVARVAKICARFGLEPALVETSIRQQEIYWDMFHVMLLWMCLAFLRPGIAHAAIAADQTAEIEMVRFPWGNCAPVVGNMSHPTFPIRQIGRDTIRSQKVCKLAEGAPDVLPLMTFCLNVTPDGLNCGTCSKCLWTRMNFATADNPQPNIFASNENLVTLLDGLPVVKRQDLARISLAWTLDNELHLPQGPLRDAVAAYRKRLQAAVIPRGRI